jgi:hypothetical protein
MLGRYAILLLSLAGCGDSADVDAGVFDAGRRDAGPRRDAGTLRDGGPRRDTGSFLPDAGGRDAGRDADGVDAACVPFECPRPPDGCFWRSDDPCECGELQCGAECGAASCGPTSYCHHLEATRCAGAGVCLGRPITCEEGPPEVCGCDGHTYENPCFAHLSGTDVAGSGPCPGKP